MKTLLTSREANGKEKQVKLANFDLDNFLMLKHGIKYLGLSDYIEMEYDKDIAYLRIYEREEKNEEDY